MSRLIDVLTKAADYLKSKGVPSPRLDAELLLAHVLKLKRLDLYLQFDRPLTEAELEAYRGVMRRRVVDKLPKDELLQADMVLVWKNTTRIEMTRIIRRLNGKTGMCPQPGEPVMCLKNCPDYGVYNGATYTLLAPFEPGHNVIQIDLDGEPMSIPLVHFEGMPNAVPVGETANTHFTFGYAYTVHKAQGSEADNVVLIDEYALQEHAEAWRYTGFTRAAKRLTVMRW